MNNLIKTNSYTIFVLMLLGYAGNGLAEQQELISSVYSPDVNSVILEDEVKQTSASEEVRGLIKPLRETVLSTDTIAKISAINYKNGDSFKQGDQLILFECDQQRAELQAALAEAKARKIVYKNNQDLAQFDAVGALELEVSKTQHDKAQAELKAVRSRNRECLISAPWNGRVTEVNAHAHEVVEPGREIMKILDDSSLEVEMIVPSKWLRWIKRGINIPMSIDETGKNYTIEISRVGAIVDPVSQTIRIFARFKDETVDILAGMSGTAFFDPQIERNF